jgi:hypothetical protein
MHDSGVIYVARMGWRALITGVIARSNATKQSNPSLCGAMDRFADGRGDDVDLLVAHFHTQHLRLTGNCAFGRYFNP